MLDGTYTGLRASIADFLNRSDLTTTIPDFIRLAEVQLNRQLNTRDMWTILPMPVSAATFPVPRDFVSVESIQSSDATVRKLGYITPQQMDLKPLNVTGSPREYTISGGDFVFWPAPDQSYTMNLRYRRMLPQLSVSTPVNWLLFKHPDAYLYGSLLQAAPYLKDDTRIGVWGQLFSAAIDQIEAQDRGIVSDSLEMRSGIHDGGRMWPDYIYGAYNP